MPTFHPQFTFPPLACLYLPDPIFQGLGWEGGDWRGEGIGGGKEVILPNNLAQMRFSYMHILANELMNAFYFVHITHILLES